MEPAETFRLKLYIKLQFYHKFETYFNINICSIYHIKNDKENIV